MLTPGKLGRRDLGAARTATRPWCSARRCSASAASYSPPSGRRTEDFGKGLVSTAVFGLLGLVMMAVAFLIVDLITPGRLGGTLVEPEPHPRCGVTAS
ncbi:DUF350 domain-containing protein [Streptomyces thinghirensis]|nr:DUF350 domain-containing protein [Streptomyces thinghirensis]